MYPMTLTHKHSSIPAWLWRKKILCVFGTRSEALKMAPVIQSMTRRRGHFKCIVCVLSLHRRSLDQRLSLFAIIPDYDLDITQSGHTVTETSSMVFQSFNEVLADCQPDMVLVRCESSLTMAAAMAAHNHNIPIGHLAGFRAEAIASPDEPVLNCRLINIVAACHFVTTQEEKQLLQGEGVDEKAIFVTGNTVIDALLEIAQMLRTNPKLLKRVACKFQYLRPNKYLVLVIDHHRKNFSTGMEQICWALKMMTDQEPKMEIVYPLPDNPKILEPVKTILNSSKSVHLIKPLDYLPQVYLMNRCRIVITNSCQVEEEAPSLGKQVLVTRNTTERSEAVRAGTVKLVGTNPIVISREALAIIRNKNPFQRGSKLFNPYGDGQAASRIVAMLPTAMRWAWA